VFNSASRIESGQLSGHRNVHFHLFAIGDVIMVNFSLAAL